MIIIPEVEAEELAEVPEVVEIPEVTPVVAEDLVEVLEIVEVVVNLPVVKDIAAKVAKRSLHSIARSIQGLSMVLETRKSLDDNLMAQEPLNGSVGTR